MNTPLLSIECEDATQWEISTSLPGLRESSEKTGAMAMTERNASESQFVDALRVDLANVGLDDAELISSAPESTAFGDTAAIFRIGPLLLRITRDRGQRFVDLATQREPTKFHQFDDIDIAMGWRSIYDVLAKRDPEPIETVLQRLRANLDVLMDAFSGDRERFTRARVEKAAYERGQAFIARLRRDQRAQDPM